MKKILLFSLVALGLFGLTACGNSGSNSGNLQSSFDNSKDISVVSREDGSGTRGAFVELFNVLVKNDDGTKKDMTTEEAIIVNQTGAMMTTVSGDLYSIGYASSGLLNDEIKAVNIDGVYPSAENIKSKEYSISRPFNIATKGETSDVVKDFINYILSSDGQAIVSKTYIAVNDSATAYTASNLSGKIVIAGSSSVTPIMEKLKEDYITKNPNVTIEIQETDSSSGMNDTINGICDIGMSSRDLKESELQELTAIPIAIDGIAVIVNKENPIENLSQDQVRGIFTGEITNWSEVVNE